MLKECTIGVESHVFDEMKRIYLTFAKKNRLLALFVEQRLCINFFVSRANFLTTLRSHLDVTCSCYFWSTLFNVDVNYNYICICICIYRTIIAP